MRIIRALTAAVAVAALAVPALAAGYPERPVTMVVPFPPGGASDQAARVVQTEFEKNLGGNVVIENRPGATGNTGAGAVARSAPDGYTLLCAALSVWSINPALFKGLNYDAAKDFDLLTVAVRTPNVLVTRKDFPAKDVKSLVEYLKANPGKVTFPSSGSGSSDHLTAELFWQKTGTTGNHIPYKGGGPAITDLIGGQTDVSFQNLGNIYPHIVTNKVNALAVTSAERHPMLPDVPTLKELGYEGLEVYSWQAIGAPKGVDPAVKAKIEDALIKALKTEAVAKAFAKTGFDVVASSEAESEAFQAKEIARWKQVVDEGKIPSP
ncbi:tripartite tricarboxylate transporter substrate binding protein [Chelatococcus sambhunathii]|uniref:Tripartite tricarboxylate transporter substrate binding protein n=1 Tax=Chelatococcus sambhunathii TaxID=363953 RepID=A0ABU1DIF9_9HYPH|nr:tripartite tricarboxylate transporter substrate binding protein [Chelatococcus sambhunathii]MDR4307789.1 tripartite tricarboxylate transporter substrate binding protein [Chelatococcus sambhunathii]